jgi:hypothetical protein
MNASLTPDELVFLATRTRRMSDAATCKLLGRTQGQLLTTANAVRVKLGLTPMDDLKPHALRIFGSRS